MENIKENYEKAVADYLNVFLKMYDFDILDAWWVSGEIGDVISIGDYFFGFRDIMLCVDRQVAWDDLLAWYDYSLEAHNLGFRAPTLKSWLAGCPRKSEKEIEEILKMQSEIEAMKKLYSELVNKNESIY